MRFAGQWFASENGLHQNWMRDYDATLGRYIQADPLGLVDGASVYGYALQNPARWSDPRGEETTVYVSYPADSPWDPGHAFLFTDNVIFDPNGSACSCQYDSEANDFFPPGSGQYYMRDPKTDKKFLDHATKNGWVVHPYVFPTTPEQEKQIEDRIDQYGGGILDCAWSVSGVLDGIGPFIGLGQHNFPSSLEKRLKELLQ